MTVVLNIQSDHHYVIHSCQTMAESLYFLFDYDNKSSILIMSEFSPHAPGHVTGAHCTGVADRQSWVEYSSRPTKGSEQWWVHWIQCLIKKWSCVDSQFQFHERIAMKICTSYSDNLVSKYQQVLSHTCIHWAGSHWPITIQHVQACSGVFGPWKTC